MCVLLGHDMTAGVGLRRNTATTAVVPVVRVHTCTCIPLTAAAVRPHIPVPGVRVGGGVQWNRVNFKFFKTSSNPDIIDEI